MKSLDMPAKTSNSKKKIMNIQERISKSIFQYAQRSSIHGISYIWDCSLGFFDRFLWLILMIGLLVLAVLLTINSYFDWKGNQVITSLKTVAKPVTELNFPAITICGEGQHMDAVEKVLYDNFREWDNLKTDNPEQTMEFRFREFMREVFMITEEGIDIMDILNALISDEAWETKAVRKHEVACRKRNTRNKRQTQCK